MIKFDIDQYESEIHDLIHNYDTMTRQDQLDNSGQIESQVKNLQNKFENIQEDVAVLMTQMNQLLTIKVQLSSCCDTIKTWIAEVDNQISLVNMQQPSNIEAMKEELQVNILLFCSSNYYVVFEGH